MALPQPRGGSMLAGSLHFCGWKASIAAPRYRICGDGDGDGAGRGGTLMEKATASAAVDATMATASAAVDVAMATASAAWTPSCPRPRAGGSAVRHCSPETQASSSKPGGDEQGRRGGERLERGERYFLFPRPRHPDQRDNGIYASGAETEGDGQGGRGGERLGRD